MINAKQLAKPFYSRTPRLKTDANRSADETDTKRLAKPFYCRTPMLKTDANRFTDSSLKNQRVLSEVRIFKLSEYPTVRNVSHSLFKEQRGGL